MPLPQSKFDRGSAASRGYGHRWRKARETYLKSHPMCVMCARLGRDTFATVVDHVTPHKGDQDLFWDKDNWQSLCAPCHDSAKKQLELSGTEAGCDVNGMPLGAAHRWNLARP